MKADYYNGELCVWEPFVEPWQCKVGFHASVEEMTSPPPPTPRKKRVGSISSLSSSPPNAPPLLSQRPTVNKSASGAFEVVVLSRTPLNVNFSKPLVDSFTTFLNLLQVCLFFSFFHLIVYLILLRDLLIHSIPFGHLCWYLLY